MESTANAILNNRLQVHSHAYASTLTKSEEKWSHKPFSAIQTHSSNGVAHTFLAWASLFQDLATYPWTVQLTTKDPVDFFLLTGEDFHPGYDRWSSNIPDRYQAFHDEASQGLLGIPITLCYGGIMSEDLAEDGSTTVRKVLLPRLTKQQKASATAVLLTFYRAENLEIVREPEAPETAQNPDRMQEGTTQEEQYTDDGSVRQHPCASQRRVPARSGAGRHVALHRYSILPISDWDRFSINGMAIFKPGYFEAAFTVPPEGLFNLLDHVRHAAVGVKDYRLPGRRAWRPTRRRTFLKPDTREWRGPVCAVDDDGQPCGWGFGTIMGFDVNSGDIDFNHCDLPEISADTRRRYNGVMDLINWDGDEEPNGGSVFQVRESIEEGATTIAHNQSPDDEPQQYTIGQVHSNYVAALEAVHEEL